MSDRTGEAPLPESDDAPPGAIPTGGLGGLLLAPFREWRAATRVPGLWRVESRLTLAYLLRLPAWFIWRERRAAGLYAFDDESFAFGETPYDVALDICAQAGLTASDTLFDLGCGRGKMVFAAALAHGCAAVGVDLLPTYIDVARGISAALGLDRVRFERQHVLDVPLDDATAVYVNGFTFNDDLAGGLQARISVLADGTRWISVGREWRHPRLRLSGKRRYPFSWGYADTWLYEVGPAGTPVAGDADNHPSFESVWAQTLKPADAGEEETP